MRAFNSKKLKFPHDIVIFKMRTSYAGAVHVSKLFPIMPRFHVQLSHATRCNNCSFFHVGSRSVLHTIIAHETTTLCTLLRWPLELEGKT